MTIPGLQVDFDSAVPVYRQIAEGVRRALLAGRLAPGAKLPPTRDLSRALGVNRNTVVSAYELLAGEGLVASRTGKGTFLVAPRSGETHAEADDEGTRWPRPLDDTPWFTGFSRAVEGAGAGQLASIYTVAISSEGISFAGTFPDSELMPLDTFRRAMDEVIGEGAAEVLGYGPTPGYPPLRQTIAAEMRDKGSPVSSAGVLVTNGAQQAMDLVFRTLLDRGDSVVLEQPTYTGALSSLQSLGARIVGVPCDEQGIRPDLLAVALERHRPRLVYLQPTFQNPTTAVMGQSRRREILALAARHRCVLVEDDWAGDLGFGDPRPPTLHALDGGRRVIYLSTFSKKLMPGLRLGWVVAPPPVMRRLEALKQIQDFGTSPLMQAALHRFLQAGGLAEHLRAVLPVYRRRRDAMLASLERDFPRGVHWTRPDGGLFLWVTLPARMNSNDLFVAARQRGVLFSRGELFHSDGSGRETLRLTYGGVTPERIESGISILGELLRKHWPAGSADTSGRPAETVPIL